MHLTAKNAIWLVHTLGGVVLGRHHARVANVFRSVDLFVFCLSCLGVVAALAIHNMLYSWQCDLQ